MIIVVYDMIIIIIMYDNVYAFVATNSQRNSAISMIRGSGGE